MDFEWNSSQPIYRQLRDRVVAMMSRRALAMVLKGGSLLMKKPLELPVPVKSRIENAVIAVEVASNTD
jgi:hypothetical protein